MCLIGVTAEYRGAASTRPVQLSQSARALSLAFSGPARTVFEDPRHPYTVGLLRGIPRAGVRKDVQRLDTIPGYLPQLGADLPACVFVERCGLREEICSQEEPDFYDLGDGRASRCYFHERAHELPRT